MAELATVAGDHERRTARRRLPAQGNPRVPALRLKQRDRLVEKRLQIARLPLQLRRLAEIEETLEMTFDERELAQRDVERLAVVWPLQARAWSWTASLAPVTPLRS